MTAGMETQGGFVDVRRRGLMLVLSSPSGAGKTSISRRLLTLEPSLTMSVSMTTRLKRPGEVAGVDHLSFHLAEINGTIKPCPIPLKSQGFRHYYLARRQRARTGPFQQ